jgi:hypothetical protein
VQQAGQRAMQLDPAARLMQIAASTGFANAPIDANAAPEIAAALNARLAALGIDPASVMIDLHAITYQDEAARAHRLVLAHVAVDGPPAFRGSYLFDHGDIVAKAEYAGG